MAKAIDIAANGSIMVLTKASKACYADHLATYVPGQIQRTDISRSNDSIGMSFPAPQAEPTSPT